MKKINPTFIVTTITLSLFVFIFFSNPSETIAQSPNSAPPSKSETKVTSSDKYTVLAPLPCIESAPTTYIDSAGNTQTNPGITCDGGNGALAKEVDFKTYVQYMINLLIALSAVTAVVMIVWGGIEYMWSASFPSKKAGLDRAKNAVYGLLLVLTSYIILRTIDPRLVEIPNTLVPQLTVEEWLTESSKLGETIDADINALILKDMEVTAELKRIQEEKLANEKKALALETNLKNEKLKDPNPITNGEILPIISDQQKVEVENRNLESAKNIKQAEETFTKILLGVANELSNEKVETVKSVKRMQAMKDVVHMQYQKALRDQVAIKSNDIDPITDQLLYTNSMIDIFTLTLTTKHAFLGYGKKIIMTKMDGTLLNATSFEEAQRYVRTELDKIKTSKDKITDKNLIQAIDEKILPIESAFQSKFRK